MVSLKLAEAEDNSPFQDTILSPVTSATIICKRPLATQSYSKQLYQRHVKYEAEGLTNTLLHFVE